AAGCSCLAGNRRPPADGLILMPQRPVRTFTVLPHLPDRLRPLHKLAYNMWWCWNHEAIALFRRIDTDLWEVVDHSPVKLLVGVGLMYREGYFRQYLTVDGWQQERYPENDFFNLPLVPETAPDGSPLLIHVTLPGREVAVRIWRIQVGRVPLYLLDTNIPQNS